MTSPRRRGFRAKEKCWIQRSKAPSQVAKAKALDKLTQLKELSLRDNKLTDVKGLEKFTQLTNLGLQGNKLTEVKGLEKLTKLKVLYLEDNPNLTKAQIAALQKALPKCKITN